MSQVSVKLDDRSLDLMINAAKHRKLHLFISALEASDNENIESLKRLSDIYEELEDYLTRIKQLGEDSED